MPIASPRYAFNKTMVAGRRATRAFSRCGYDELVYYGHARGEGAFHPVLPAAAPEWCQRLYLEGDT